MRTLLCFGDSNTQGVMPVRSLQDIRRYGPEVRWTGRLARLLPGWRVLEEGGPGRTTVHDDPIEGAHRNGLTVLRSLLESHAPIDLVLLMLGTNDLHVRFSVSAMDIALSIEKLILAILSSGSGPDRRAPGLIVVSPPPIREVGILGNMFTGAAAKSREMGPMIEAVAKRHDARFIDLGDVVEVSEVDGIHYDEAFQEVMARTFAASITSIDLGSTTHEAIDDGDARPTGGRR